MTLYYIVRSGVTVAAYPSHPEALEVLRIIVRRAYRQSRAEALTDEDVTRAETAAKLTRDTIRIEAKEH